MAFAKELTVLAADVTGGPLTDFPLLVSITDTDLQQNARPDGFDIFFTKADGVTVIPYDREFYDNTTGELIAWVLLDLSDTVDNNFFMFYGNPDATDQQNPLPVWDGRFNDVFHFNQSSPLPWLNSSVGKDFTIDAGSIPTIPTLGQIGNGSTHSASDTIFKMALTGVFTPTDYFVSMWVKRDSTTIGNNFIDHFNSDATSAAGFTPFVIGNDVSPDENSASVLYLGTPDDFLAGDLSDLAYHYVAARVTSGTPDTIDIFFDGNFVSTNSLTFTDTLNFDELIMGGAGGPDLRAAADETRVAFNSNFSNGFIKTSFDNQKTSGQGAGNFVKVGTQQSIISNEYLVLSQGPINNKSSSIVNAVCGDSSLLIGDVVRLLPSGTGEGFIQPDDILPRVGIANSFGATSYGIVVGGDFEGVYSDGVLNLNSNNLALGVVASFFGDGVRICTKGRCLALVNGTTPINIGDELTPSPDGFLVKAIDDNVIARALQPTSELSSIIAVDVQREGN